MNKEWLTSIIHGLLNETKTDKKTLPQAFFSWKLVVVTASLVANQWMRQVKLTLHG